MKLVWIQTFIMKSGKAFSWDYLAPPEIIFHLHGIVNYVDVLVHDVDFAAYEKRQNQQYGHRSGDPEPGADPLIWFASVFGPLDS